MATNNSALSAVLASVFLGACATPERVVLLPEADGSPSAVVVRSNKAGKGDKGGDLRLDRPYAVASVKPGQLTAETTDEKSVNTRYKAVMEALPMRARSYTLNFEFGKAVLTSDSRSLLDKILQEMGQLPAPEMIIVGHTDDVGTDAVNDRLSLERANSVLSLIKAKGIVPRDVTTVGRGKRDPLTPAKSGTAEPRNRRVEIRIK